MQKKFAFLLTFIPLLSSQLGAQTELIQNGGFEHVGVENYAAQIGIHEALKDGNWGWTESTAPGGSLSQGLQTVTGWYTEGYHFLMTPSSATNGGAGTSWNDRITFWATNNQNLINDTDPDKLVPAALSYIPATSPSGGNFIALDGAYTFGSWQRVVITPGYWDSVNNIWVNEVSEFKYGDPETGQVNLSLPIMQEISGLEIGQEYELSFYWAAAQQYGYTGATWEYLHVSLEDDVNQTFSYNSEENPMPEGGFQAWTKETLRFTATGTTRVLSFLAGGGPDGQPPFVFLDAVSMKAVPEPGTFVAMATGLAGLLLLRARRQKKE